MLSIHLVIASDIVLSSSFMFASISFSISFVSFLVSFVSFSTSCFVSSVFSGISGCNEVDRTIKRTVVLLLPGFDQPLSHIFPL